jgi:hypothetical protein
MIMTLKDEKVRVNVIMEADLLEKVDKMANDAGMSRSATVTYLIKLGYRQAQIANKVAGNSLILKGLQLLFGFSPDDIDKAKKEVLLSKDAEVARMNALENLKKLSIAEAEAEINRDLRLGEEVSK